MITLLGCIVFIYVVVTGVKKIINNLKLQDEYEKKAILNEKNIWNNGYCQSCGRKWKYKYFFMRGGVSAIALDCYNCKIHSELYLYDPIKHI